VPGESATEDHVRFRRQTVDDEVVVRGKRIPAGLRVEETVRRPGNKCFHRALDRRHILSEVILLGYVLRLNNPSQTMEGSFNTGSEIRKTVEWRRPF
jgi:hypothetical protein